MDGTEHSVEDVLLRGECAACGWLLDAAQRGPWTRPTYKLTLGEKYMVCSDGAACTARFAQDRLLGRRRTVLARSSRQSSLVSCQLGAARPLPRAGWATRR